MVLSNSVLEGPRSHRSLRVIRSGFSGMPEKSHQSSLLSDKNCWQIFKSELVNKSKNATGA